MLCFALLACLLAYQGLIQPSSFQHHLFIPYLRYLLTELKFTSCRAVPLYLETSDLPDNPRRHTYILPNWCCVLCLWAPVIARQSWSHPTNFPFLSQHHTRDTLCSYLGTLLVFPSYSLCYEVISFSFFPWIDSHSLFVIFVASVTPPRLLILLDL